MNPDEVLLNVLKARDKASPSPSQEQSLRELDELIVRIMTGFPKYPITAEEISRFKKQWTFKLAKKAFTDIVQESNCQARIGELKQLEPPEVYEEYAKLMGHDYCTICGFNALKFRRHIKDRIKALKDHQGGEI